MTNIYVMRDYPKTRYSPSYSSVRSTAQGILHSFDEVFPYCQKLLLPRLTEIFTSSVVSHDEFKGALYFVKPYLTMYSWDVVRHRSLEFYI